MVSSSYFRRRYWSPDMPDALAPPATAGRALQIDIRDPEMQAYLQRYPFASGPDEKKNEDARTLLAGAIRFREPSPPASAFLLEDAQTTLDAATETRVQALLAAVGLTPQLQKEKHTTGFAWKAQQLPRTARNVLVIGCGDGVELLYLRAALPQARLTAVDYYAGLLPGVEQSTGVVLHVGDMNAILGELAPGFDLVFSNHTMEHLYSPEHTLGLLSALLVPGGTLASALPICGCAGFPFSERVHALIAARQRHAPDSAAAIHPVDVVYLDTGHPWKTELGDLQQTLETAGFARVTVYERRNHLGRYLPVAREEFDSRRSRDLRMHRMLIAPMQWLVKAAFPRRVPPLVLRSLFAIERRVPFGTNNLQNLYSEEGLFVCSKP